MQVVAIDCEMVGSTSRDLLAKVSIVDREGNILLDEFVKPTDVVTDYRTEITGFTKNDHGPILNNAKSIVEIQNKVLNLLRGKLLVGHSLHIDLNALQLSHPEINQRDLANYGPFLNNGQPQSLKILAQKHLQKTIQTGVHDSVTDARTAMELYRLVAHSWN